MPELELFLHDQHVGIVRPVSRDRSRVMLDIDRGYRQ
jgi:serine/threonine-protein kinase HipA